MPAGASIEICFATQTALALHSARPLATGPVPRRQVAAVLVEIAAACAAQQSWAGMRNALYRALEIQTDRLGPGHVEVTRNSCIALGTVYGGSVSRGDLVIVEGRLALGSSCGGSGRSRHL